MTRMILKIAGLELLVIFFFTLNGAYVTMTNPLNPMMQYIGVVPLALMIALYLTFKKKWKDYFSFEKSKISPLLYSPLLLVLLIILVGNNGLNTAESASNFFLILISQLFIIAFIEEMVFRGFMMNILLAKGFKAAVIITSLLFALTHSLQLLGGQSLEETLIQISYAFVVGMTLSLLIVNGQSMVVAIVFHGFNNFLQMSAPDSEGSFILSCVLITILLVYAIILWRRAVKQEGASSKISGKIDSYL